MFIFLNCSFERGSVWVDVCGEVTAGLLELLVYVVILLLLFSHPTVRVFLLLFLLLYLLLGKGELGRMLPRQRGRGQNFH
jgi:hypothetical protein